jgi:hypothetical protein
MECLTEIRDAADVKVKLHDCQFGGSSKQDEKNCLMGNMVAINMKMRGSGIGFAEQHRLF